MKRILGLILLLVVIIGITGCYNAGYYDEDEEDGADVFSDDSDEEDKDGFDEEDEGEFGEDLFDDDELEDLFDEQDSENSEEFEEVFEDVEDSNSDKAESPVRSGTLSGTTLTVTEGDLVELDVKGSDPDGDKLTYTFSDPLNKNGRWQTEIGDAGTYQLTVVASDGVTSVEKVLKLVVLEQNKAPVINLLRDVEVDEGKTLDLDLFVEYFDPEGDDVVVEVSGWMNELKKKMSYSDAGTYDVKVSVSDEAGKEASISFKVKVNDVNRAPDFDIVIG